MTDELTLAERKVILEQQILRSIAQGARIQSQSDTTVVMIFGKPINHLLHFIIGIFTLGLWWIMWIALALSGGEHRQTITVDEFGKVWWNNL